MHFKGGDRNFLRAHIQMVHAAHFISVISAAGRASLIVRSAGGVGR